MKFASVLAVSYALIFAPLAHADIKNPLDPASPADLACIDTYGGGITVSGPIFGVSCVHESNGDTVIKWCTDRYGAVCKVWRHQHSDPTQWGCSYLEVNGVQCRFVGGPAETPALELLTRSAGWVRRGSTLRSRPGRRHLRRRPWPRCLS